MTTTYRVDGMTCGGCVRSVTNALERAGLQASVDLAEKSATVQGEHQADTVKQAIEGAGFDFGGPVTDGQG